MSHELRNPLAVIRSSSYYLRSKLEDNDPKVAKHVTRIEEQVARCNAIIVELLQYTRGSPSHAIPGDINPWLDKVLDDIGDPPPGVALVRDLAPSVPTIKYDREKLQSVVVNLVENSFNAVIERMISLGGTDQSYEPIVKVTTESIDKGLRIEVSDNGIGMDEETARHAFEPLYTTKARGTGLGLSIVRKVAEEHGAKVFLNTSPNLGTTISIVLNEESLLD